MRSPAPPAPEPPLLDAVPPALARRAPALPLEVRDGVLRVRSLRGDDAEPVLDADATVGLLSMRDTPTEHRLMFERYVE